MKRWIKSNLGYLILAVPLLAILALSVSLQDILGALGMIISIGFLSLVYVLDQSNISMFKTLTALDQELRQLKQNRNNGTISLLKGKKQK